MRFYNLLDQRFPDIEFEDLTKMSDAEIEDEIQEIRWMIEKLSDQVTLISYKVA